MLVTLMMRSLRAEGQCGVAWGGMVHNGHFRSQTPTAAVLNASAAQPSRYEVYEVGRQQEGRRHIDRPSLLQPVLQLAIGAQ